MNTAFLGRTQQRGASFDGDVGPWVRGPVGGGRDRPAVDAVQRLQPGLTGELSGSAQPDYLSGLLIGHELSVLATVQRRRRNSVHLLSIILIGVLNSVPVKKPGARRLRFCSRQTLAEHVIERGAAAVGASLLDRSTPTPSR